MKLSVKANAGYVRQRKHEKVNSHILVWTQTMSLLCKLTSFFVSSVILFLLKVFSSFLVLSGLIAWIEKIRGVKHRGLDSLCSQQILHKAPGAVASAGHVSASKVSLLPSGHHCVLPTCTTNCCSANPQLHALKVSAVLCWWMFVWDTSVCV